MPTFTKKYLKDKDGNYLAPASLAELIQHNDGETTEVKMQVVEDKLGTGVLDTVAQDMTGAINELKPIADEVITARTDANGTYNSLDERLDAMDIKIAAAGGGGTIDLSAYQMKDDNGLQTTSKQVVGAINEINDDMLVLEDFVGNGTTVNDVTTRVATLESDYTAINNELTDSRTDTDGTVHGTLGQRLDEIEGSYLPLTGGTLTGNLNLTNNLNYRLQQADGTNINALGMDSGGRIYVGSGSNPLTIQSNGLYVDGKTNFNTRVVIDNDRSLAWKAQDGTEIPIMAYNTVLHIGHTDSPTIIYGSDTSWRGNFMPCYDQHVGSWDIGYMDKRWGTLWAAGVDTTGNIHSAADIIVEPGKSFNLRKQDGGNVFVYTSTATNRLIVQGATMCLLDGNLIPGASNSNWVGTDDIPFHAMRVGTGGYTQASDENLKEDIRVVTDEQYFDLVKQVPVKSYLYKETQDGVALASDRTQEDADDNSLNVGIIAQDMANHEVGKYVLNCSEQGMYSVNLYNYTASIHSALRHEISLREELQQENQELKEQVNDLQVQLEEIKNHVGL